MKIKIKHVVICIGLLIFNCKNESITQSSQSENKTEVTPQLTEDEKTEIVKYYLINGRKLAEKDFYKIIFLNDAIDGVKIIHYEGRDAFFGFKFSEALNYYNANK